MVQHVAMNAQPTAVSARDPQALEAADRKLIQRVRQGYKAAFDDLVEKYRERVYQMVRGMIGDPEESLDLTQETFIRAFESLPYWEPRAQFQTWLYRIAINLCVDYCRRRARRGETSGLDFDWEYLSEPSPLANPATALEFSELHSAFRRAVAKLPDKQQTIFNLRYDRDLSMSEIAAELGCPEGTVKGLLFRARARLWDELQPFL